MAELFEDSTSFFSVIGGLLITMIPFVAIYASRFQRVPPNKVLLVYGRPRAETHTYFDYGKMMAGRRMVGYRAILGGGTFVAPIVGRAARLSLESTTLEVKLPSVRTKDGRTISVEMTAEVKLKGDASSLRAASEQFLGKPHSEVVVAARKILEARARTVLSSMTLDEINADRKATETKLGEKLYEDMQRSGLSLTILVLKEVAVEKDTDNILSDENIKPGDLFKVVKNSRGELVVKKVDSGVEV